MSMIGNNCCNLLYKQFNALGTIVYNCELVRQLMILSVVCAALATIEKIIGGKYIEYSCLYGEARRIT
jgi:hypothetical protein